MLKFNAMLVIKQQNILALNTYHVKVQLKDKNEIVNFARSFKYIPC